MNKTGFGYLRLPRLDANDETSTNFELLNAMVDDFFARGGDYFDTSYTYLKGASEEGLRKSVVERYPRSSFRIADKLPAYKATCKEDLQAMFDEELKRCGVDYFDVYLLHWLNEANYEICEKFDGFGFLRKLKEKGLAKKIGFSYHDNPDLLDRILCEHPETEYVQLQINYLDWESPALQARACYEVAVKHNKPVIIMEPVKGGSLAKLPEEAEALLRSIHPDDSAASWAIRFATDLEHVELVLSGMNSMEQIADNMRDFAPLSDAERRALDRAAEIIRSNTIVPCTGCAYCVPHCPQGIPIPRHFRLLNDSAITEKWKIRPAYNALALSTAKASACVECRQCEKNCPQKIEITQFLKQAAKAFEV